MKNSEKIRDKFVDTTFLIFNDLFNEEFPSFLGFLKKLLLSYNKFKLKILINKFRKNNNKNFEIELINYHNKFNLSGIKKEFILSDLRQDLTRNEYIEIINRVKQNTRNINSLFLKNLKKLKIFNIRKIEFGNLLEMNLIRFLNQYSGEIELIRGIIKKKKPDKVIFFNCNGDLIKIIKNFLSDSNTQYYNEIIITFFSKIIKEINFILFFLMRITASFFNRYKKLDFPKNKKNVVFIANSINQFRAIKPIFKKLNYFKDINPILYVQKNALPISNLVKYFNFLRRVLLNWKRYHNNICQNMGVYHNLMKFFYKKELRYLLSYIFNEYHQLSTSFRDNLISVVTISNQHRVEHRTAVSFCKLKKIPTIYIPHASVPIDNEVICKKKISYLALWGKKDIDFYKNQLGTSMDQLIVTGNPRFENFYNKKLNILEEVRDMFSNRIYKFNPNKFTILLATNLFDKVSNEKFITTIVNSLKELNLLDNLIIKLHPEENGIEYKAILKNLNINPIIVRDYNVLELINSSSLLISCISSIILEAMIIGTPVILTEFINLDFIYARPYGFTNEHFVRVAKTSQSLI